MKKLSFLLILTLSLISIARAQDTIKVQTFTWDDNHRVDSFGAMTQSWAMEVQVATNGIIAVTPSSPIPHALTPHVPQPLTIPFPILQEQAFHIVLYQRTSTHPILSMKP